MKKYAGHTELCLTNRFTQVQGRDKNQPGFKIKIKAGRLSSDWGSISSQRGPKKGKKEEGSEVP